MKSYIVRTHADREFDGYYVNTNILNTGYEEDGAVLVLETECEEWYASVYEGMLDQDSAVISYKEA